MERVPLHSWEMEFSIQYHVTINSQLNDQNSIRYYIKNYEALYIKLSIDFIQFSGQKIILNCDKFHFKLSNMNFLPYLNHRHPNGYMRLQYLTKIFKVLIKLCLPC
jgi:hypothetical protein